MKRYLLFLALGGSALAAPPAWWSDSQNGILVPGAAPNNAGPVAGAQLKNVAKKAALYMNNTLPAPGAGAKISALVAGFQKNPGDMSPVAISQLKAVAKPFYQRLHDVGFDTKQSLNNHINPGAPSWLYDFPWNPTTPVSQNGGIASLGQLKWVFSFDLTGFTVVDTDTDGIPNNWESDHGLNPSNSADGSADLDGDGQTNFQEYLMGTDPQDFWNATSPVFIIVDGNARGGLPGAVMTPALMVKVSNSLGTPKSGLTVNFSMLSGGGSLQAIQGTTDSQGLAKATLVLPAIVGATPNVRARLTVAGINYDIIFTETVGDPNVDPVAPAKPVITEEHGATSAVVEWEDRSNNEAGFRIERSAGGGVWNLVNTVGPNVTSWVDNAITMDAVYFYRITSFNNSTP